MNSMRILVIENNNGINVEMICDDGLDVSIAQGSRSATAGRLL
jgi:hypothetical protein